MLKLSKYQQIILCPCTYSCILISIYCCSHLDVELVLLRPQKHLTKFECLTKIFLKRIWDNSCHYALYQPLFWSLCIFQNLCTKYVSLGRTLENLIILSKPQGRRFHNFLNSVFMSENSFLSLMDPVPVKVSFPSFFSLFSRVYPSSKALFTSQSSLYF